MSEASAAHKWYSVSIDVRAEAAEAMEFALNSLDSLGTEISSFRKRPDGSVRVIGYFNEPPTELALSGEIAHAFSVYGLLPATNYSLTLGEVEDRDWLAEWKKHWTPQTIGRFVIAPPWFEVDEPDKIVVRIEPSMAFGTGTHETTQLCLRAIDENYRAGLSFLDVGTGTGILAIAAAKLGNLTTENTGSMEGPKEFDDALSTSLVSSVPSAAKILACDTDAEAINIARENARLNDVGTLIEFIEGPLSVEAPQFDVVCANLTLADILPILSPLVSKAKTQLILSGILVEQEHEIVTALNENSITDLKIEKAEEWVAVTGAQASPLA